LDPSKIKSDDPAPAKLLDYATSRSVEDKIMDGHAMMDGDKGGVILEAV